MSPCPSCGKKAVHYGVVVPWETLETPDVLHKCACGLLFIETAPKPVLHVCSGSSPLGDVRADLEADR